MKNILVYTIDNFSLICGGVIVQYELCRILDNLGINVRMSAPTKIINSVFNKFYENDFDLNDTVVIYGETITNNPINAPHVVRWILAPLGLCSDINIYKTWGSKDLVYYFNSEQKMANNPDKFGQIYKLLNIIFLYPNIKNYNENNRSGTCFTIRKGYSCHPNMSLIHPSNSFEITRQHSQSDCISIFNNHEYFICYDSITFLYVIAGLCGCISIVVPVNGLSKQDWINTTVLAEYFKESEEKVLYGIAYGMEDIEFAKNTINLVKEQWSKIIQFSKDKYILSFIDDINNWDSNINTIQNNFY